MKSDRLLKLLVWMTLFFGVHSLAQAQLSIDLEMGSDEIGQNLVGEGIEIFNVSVIAADSSYGYYESMATELGSSQGLLITTGKAINALGPNDESGLPELEGSTCLTCDFYDNEFPGSSLISDANAGLVNWDACQFQFDFIPQGDTVRFDYAFASEEYIEWVGSSFNDAFGFFVSGPGIGTDVNVALIPGTSTTVAINNVNHIDNTEFFFHNEDPDGLGVQYDGFTVNTFVEFPVESCETYTIKLIVADGTDRMYDSGVFISELSSNPVVIQTATAEGLDYMIEGCNDGSVNFVAPFTTDEDTEVIFTLDGSAELGLDYTTSPDLSPFYDALTDTYTLTIPAGEDQIGFDINTIIDGLEGIEFIEISLLEQYCGELIFNSQVQFEIYDELPIELTPESAEICPNQEVQLIGFAETNGTAVFTWSPETGLDDPSSLTPIASPDEDTIYTLTSTAGACSNSASTEISVLSLDIIFDVTNVNCSDGNDGAILIDVSNGVEPYTFEWSGPNDFTSTDQNISNLAIGIYCVSVLDESGCGTEACVEVIEENLLTISLNGISEFECDHISCNGFNDGFLDIEVSGGSGDYTFDWSNDETSEDISSLTAGTYTVIVSDVDGCSTTASWTLTEPDALVINLINQTDLLCDGTTTGAIEVAASGGCPVFEYNWSHDPILDAELATDLGTGEYTVSVTDANGCNSVNSIDVFINPPIDPLLVVVDNISSYPGGFGVSCPGANDGSIDITISGGTSGYDVEWTDEDGNTYSDEDLTGLACGTYDLLVVDANGCEFEESVTISCVPAIQIDFTTVQNPCSDPNAMLGEISITGVSGGHGGPYTTSWISGPSCPCVGDNLTNLDVGVYVYQVIDILGCVQEFPITIGVNDEIIVTPTVIDEDCFGACNGSISLDIFPSDVDIISWSFEGVVFSDQPEVFELCAGTYEVFIENGDCAETFTYTINTVPEITIDVIDTTPPTCVGLTDGSAEIAVSGGVGTLDVQWLDNPDCDFIGNSDLIQNNLGACDYIVEVTDDNGCTVSEVISLESVQAITVFTQVSPEINGFNLACFGDEDAEITVNVSGGTPDCVLFDPYCYAYDWSFGDDVSAFGNPADSNFVSVGAGTYVITVTDAQGCTGSDVVIITEPEEIQSDPIISNIVCSEETNGSIDPNISGGSGDFVIYEWTGNLGDNSPNASILTNLEAGIYELYVEDSNGCFNNFTYEIIENDPVLIIIDNFTDITCFGLDNGTISITASGGTGDLDITWIGPGSPAGTVLTGLEPGVYTVTATDELGCSTSLSFDLTEPEELIIDLDLSLPNDTALFNIACNGEASGSITSILTGGSPDYTYTWSDCDDNFIGNTADLFDLPAGCYQLEVIDDEGCIANETVELTEPDAPLAVSSTVSLYPNGFNISCYDAMDGSVDLDVTGGVPNYIYVWELNDEVFDFNEDQDNLDEGLYEVLVTDANSCDTLISFQLIQPLEIFINASVTQYGEGFNVSCNDSCNGEISILPSGGSGDLEIDWGFEVTDTLNLENLCADSYSVTVTDVDGCDITQVFSLVAPEAIVFDPIISELSCFGDEDASIEPNVSGGIPEYIFNWSPNGEETEDISNLESGEYCLEVEDANGCVNSECWTIEEPDEIQASAAIIDAECGACDGQADLTVTGGMEPYVYSWGEEDQIDLCPDTYIVTVTDDASCTIDIEVEVGGPDPLIVNENITNILCNGDGNGAINIDLSGGESPFDISWFDSEENSVGTGETIDELSPGTYDVEILWGEDCVSQFSYGVSEPGALIIEGSSPEDPFGFNVTTEGGDDGSIDTEVSGGTPEYEYFWEGPTEITDNTDDPNMLLAGSYMLTVIDANGCSMDTTFVLTEPSGLALPNGMTPNGDGANDFFVILGIHLYPENEFKVFNRWGNIVYSKSNYNNEWNGTNNDGEELPNGTYYVIFEAEDVQLETFVDLRR